MNIDDQAIREFREVYLVSNTPLYLFKKLRQLQAVQQLAQDADAKELFAEYLRRVEAEERTLDDVATAYACLVAITYKDPSEATSLLRSLDPAGLDWTTAIRNLYFIKIPAGNTYSIKIQNPSVPTARLDGHGTTSSAYTEPPKPKIERKDNI
jgi:hypothetical protein